MKYHITLIDQTLHTLDLPVDDTITWEDFENLSQVRALGQTVWDVTPDGMPDRFSEEELMSRQVTNMGLKKTVNVNGAPEYEDIVEEE